MFCQWLCISILILIIAPIWAQDDRTKAIRRDWGKSVSERRVALVIGNNAYTKKPLNNPVNDADSMAASLKACGFTVHQHTDLNRKELPLKVRLSRMRQPRVKWLSMGQAPIVPLWSCWWK